MANDIIFDMEADGLLNEATVIHCITTKYGGAIRYWYDGPDIPGMKKSGSIKDFINYIKDSYLVGHNICNYDIPLLEKLGYISKERALSLVTSCRDTMLMSCLYEPETPHSLDYYGKKLGMLKPVHEDWTTFTKDMLIRCKADVEINGLLYEKFLKLEKVAQWQDALELEQKVSYIHSQQGQYGIRIDILRAFHTLQLMDKRIDELTEKLYDMLPLDLIKGNEIKKPFLRDGTLSKATKDYFDKCDLTPFPITVVGASTDPLKFVKIGGPFSRVSFEPVNLNSHARVKDLLLSLGWVPTEYNYKKDKNKRIVYDERGKPIKTSPRLTEDSYASLPEGLGRRIGELLTLKHRRRFILNESDPEKGLLSYVKVPNGRVSADGFTCGTNTGRYRHFGALVNLPKPKTVWGKEIRELFCVQEDHLMLGIDLSGIEARIMAHYAHYYDGGKYASVVLNPDGTEKDIHQENANILGISREKAKSFLYAISYGAKPPKIASVVGTSVPNAKKLVDKYWDTHDGLSQLIRALEDEYDKCGYILGIDGRKLFIRSKHKLLNTLVQNAAAVVFKRWMVKVQEYLIDRPYLAKILHQIIAYHDELEFELEMNDVEEAEYICKDLVKLIKEVGKEMSLNVPITGEYKIGKNYAEVH